MIVQPSSLGPRSRPRRALRAAALVLPVVLFVAVVGVGLAGPAPRPDTAPSAAPGSPAPAVAVVDASPSPDAPPARMDPVFPAVIGGLQVHGVPWTLEARSRGLARGVIAIGGYLGENSIPAGCSGGRLGIFGPFCERTAILAEVPWEGGPRLETDLPPYHLHPQIPVGVRVPYQASLIAGPLDDPSPAVVVIARFDDPRATPCVPQGRHCGQELVIERVAWVEGRDFPAVPTIDPALGTAASTGADRRDEAATARDAMTSDGYELLTAYMLPAMLSQFHPEAAEGLAPDHAVWYVRGLHRAGDPSLIDWLVMDPGTGRIVARGSIPTSRFAMGSGADGDPGAPVTPPGG